MKKLLVLLAMLLLSFNSEAKALDTLSIKYMPMHVGDFWIYESSTTVLGHTTYVREKLSAICSRQINNHIYYYLKSNLTNPIVYLRGYYRVDSLTGSLLKYDSTGYCPRYYFENISDSLAAINGDTTNNCTTHKFKCTGNTSAFIFGVSTTKLNMAYSSFSNGVSILEDKNFLRGFGLYSFSSSVNGGGVMGHSGYILKGCRINGIIYGDTTTAIIQISTEIPSSYSLSQNYPNPFNPITNVKFQIVNSGDVKLIVYDIMGKEVQTLVNERLQPGTYEATFDGSMLNSGVYFYKLVTNGFTETKKMLMIK